MPLNSGRQTWTSFSRSRNKMSNNWENNKQKHFNPFQDCRGIGSWFQFELMTLSYDNFKCLSTQGYRNIINVSRFTNCGSCLHYFPRKSKQIICVTCWWRTAHLELISDDKKQKHLVTCTTGNSKHLKYIYLCPLSTFSKLAWNESGNIELNMT